MFQDLTFGEILVLVGMLMFTAAISMIAARVIDSLFWRALDTMCDFAITRKLLRSRRLVVSRKRHIGPNEIVRRESIKLHGYAAIGFITLTAPQKDMWVVMVDLPLGPFRYDGLAIEIDQTQWLELAPGDEIDNPHFGGIRAAAIVDPEIENWLRRTAGAGA